MKKIVLLLALCFCFQSCYRDVDIIKNKAPYFFKQRDYSIVSYDGYESNLCMGFNGGFVAYQVVDKKGFVYSLKLCEWDGEIHIYNQECLNAVSNK